MIHSIHAWAMMNYFTFCLRQSTSIHRIRTYLKYNNWSDEISKHNFLSSNSSRFPILQFSASFRFWHRRVHCCHFVIILRTKWIIVSPSAEQFNKNVREQCFSSEYYKMLLAVVIINKETLFYSGTEGLEVSCIKKNEFLWTVLKNPKFLEREIDQAQEK